MSAVIEGALPKNPNLDLAQQLFILSNVDIPHKGSAKEYLLSGIQADSNGFQIVQF